MPTFVDLSRRFQELGPDHRADPEVLAAFNDADLGGALGWHELLEGMRTVLLAEAGSGKTEEMRAQVRRIVADGKSAWFLPLEALAKEPVAALLLDAERSALAAWSRKGDCPGWFLLDAVDELKLTGGKFERALARLGQSIEGHLGRARIVISCRPNDWRPDFDLRTLDSILPVPEPRRTVGHPDDAFVAVLRRQDVHGSRVPPNVGASEPARQTKVVTMLPMGAAQIEAFARAAGAVDVAEFMAEIEREDAWAFARRPLDLTELIEIWLREGRLGTRREQHEANVAAKLRDDPDRPDRGLLPDAEARTGAERLALALTLTRNRAIRSPERSAVDPRAEGALDAAAVLPDWSEGKRQALLRRAMFDPATYGRVRFHHRSVQEYLAACRLSVLIGKGMSRKTTFRLLFADVYGTEVVVPSMRPVAAWLALQDPGVRAELARREPEALLGGGDPQSLPTNARAALLRAFAARYGDGGARRVHIPLEEIRRLAHPDLAPVVRELWGTGPANLDVRELLLELMWKGALRPCADLAEAAAQELAWDASHRAIAVRALLACGRSGTVSAMVVDLLASPTAWPGDMVRHLATELFPAVLSVDELLSLVEREGADDHVDGFGWITLKIARSMDASKTDATQFRDGLAKLVEKGRKTEIMGYRFESTFSHLTPALAELCLRQLAPAARDGSVGLVRCCAVAVRFGHDETSARTPIQGILDAVRSDSSLKRAAFWEDLALVDRLRMVGKSIPERIYLAGATGLAGGLGEGDRGWLEAALDRTAPADRRAIAFEALLDMWVGRGRRPAEADALRAAVQGDVVLSARVEAAAAAPGRNEAWERLKRQERRREQHAGRKESKRLANWQAWRAKVVDDPAAAFSVGEQANTLWNLQLWLEARTSSRNQFAVWNGPAVAEAFSPEFERVAAQVLRGFWRANRPLAWSERAPGERGRMPRIWTQGLCGLQAEAAEPGWAGRLSVSEAGTAATYCMAEMNGLAAFSASLADAHPAEVEDVLGREFEAQLAQAVPQAHLPLVQDLRHAPLVVKCLLLPRMVAALDRISLAGGGEAAVNSERHLGNVLDVVVDAASGEQRSTATGICIRSCTNSTGTGMVWLRALLALDFEAAAEAVVSRLEAAEPESAECIETIAELFGNHEILKIDANPDRRAELLGRLLLTTYKAVPPARDVSHRGMYTPDTRDRAVQGRNFLLSALLDTPGPTTVRTVLALATEPEFAHFPDRMRLFARRRAAEDSEPAASSLADIAVLDARQELPPSDRDGLFRVMTDRLDDLQHDLAHGDFSDRRTLRTVSEESEMQLTLSWRLLAKANGAYVVTREDEVADAKRTDIRLHAVTGGQKAVCEIKLADRRWSITDLERALHAQLVGQYLRHEFCKAGCLLLIWDGTKKHWVDPGNGRRMNFTGLVAYLVEKARTVEAENNFSMRVGVLGLDLTDPQLAVAHGPKTPREPLPRR